MSHTVLIVEDNADIREILRITLSGAGFVVVAAETAREAMQKLEQLSRLDLVLADFNLPDGKHLVPDLKKVRPELPVIVLSGDAYSARAALPQADAVLSKPLTGTSLVRKCDACFRRRELKERLDRRVPAGFAGESCWCLQPKSYYALPDTLMAPGLWYP